MEEETIPDLTAFRARVGNHNPRLIYLDPIDKPEGERGGGSENMAAVITWQSPDVSAGLAAWMVDVINDALDNIAVPVKIRAKD